MLELEDDDICRNITMGLTTFVLKYINVILSWVFFFFFWWQERKEVEAHKDNLVDQGLQGEEELMGLQVALEKLGPRWGLRIRLSQ